MFGFCMSSYQHYMSDKILPVCKQGLGPFHFNSIHQLDYLQKSNSIKHHKKNKLNLF